MNVHVNFILIGLAVAGMTAALLMLRGKQKQAVAPAPAPPVAKKKVNLDAVGRGKCTHCHELVPNVGDQIFKPEFDRECAKAIVLLHHGKCPWASTNGHPESVPCMTFDKPVALPAMALPTVEQYIDAKAMEQEQIIASQAMERASAVGAANYLVN
jgi:hypothetical protein